MLFFAADLEHFPSLINDFSMCQRLAAIGGVCLKVSNTWCLRESKDVIKKQAIQRKNTPNVHYLLDQ